MMLGFRTDIGNLLQAADIVALPTLREGLSISLLEAIAAGKPVVASAIGSIIEVIQDNHGGLLVPPEDPAALADAIIRVGNDPELAKRMSEEAREVFVAKYTEKRMNEQYAELYQDLVKDL